MARGILQILTKPIVGAKDSFYSIDLLRGLAAISILIFHFKNFGGGGGILSRGPEKLDRIAALHPLHLIRESGSLAVMLFWVISGFVFMNVYGGRKPAPRPFWVNRMARLYPLHLLTLVIIAIIQTASLSLLGHWLIYPLNDVKHFLLQLIFASAWVSSESLSFNGPVWSVSVEVLIYALFYLYVRFARVNVVSAGAGLLFFLVVMKLVPGWQVPVCGAFFFGGMLAYAGFRLWPEKKRVQLLACAVASFAFFAVFGSVVGGRLPLTLLLLPIFCSLLVAIAASEQLGLAKAYSRLHVIGDITYSTYMWHVPLQLLFLFGAGLGWWSVDNAFTNTFFVSYLVVVCSVAWLSFHFIERPTQRWVRAFAEGSKTRDTVLIAAP